MTEVGSPFSPTIPNFQVVWDSTSLGWLKTCPRYYQYQMLQQWEPKSRSIHLVFGGLYAAALERYAHTKASGTSHDDATLAMVKWAMENSGERTWDETQCAETPVGPGTWLPWSPTEPEANIKNRYTLIRALVWNAEERLTSPFTTLILANGKPATELSFTFAAFDLHGETISLSGHLDEVVQEPDGSLWVRDDKTTKNSLDASYFSRYTPDNQMSLYSYAGRIILPTPIRGVLVKGAQMAVGFVRFRTAQIPRPPSVLAEWFEDTKYWIGQAREFALKGYYPQNDKSCFLCSFKKICAVSPSHRTAHLEADFVHRVWNPVEARGNI